MKNEDQILTTQQLQSRIHELEAEVKKLNLMLQKDSKMKYGLRWIDVPEAFEKESENSIPILEEVKENAISNDDGKPTHVLIEGDNFHALKCLNYTHKGKIDVIYIDPPYNTENGFVYHDKRVMDKFPDGVKIDMNHPLRHSAWLSFMSKRLELAKNLLSEKGILAISIGHQELNNLMLLCESIFPKKYIVCVTVQTSSGNVVTNGFTYLQEYIVFITPMEFESNEIEDEKSEYSSPYHGMNLSGFNQTQRPNQVYPIFIDKNGKIVGCGKSLQERIDEGSYIGKKEDFKFDYADCPKGTVAVWPVTNRGDSCVWRLIPNKLLSNWEKGYIKIIPNKKGKNKFTVQYLAGGIIEQIENGKLETHKENDDCPTLEVIGFKTSASSIPTIWTDNKFLTAAGSRDLKDIFATKIGFPFPKPVELINEILRRVSKENDVILDFFAGSGTTLHATMKLNESDGGNRQCILVQQDENGICRNVTYERNRRVMQGYENSKGEKVAGLGNSLKYYKTAFVGKNDAINATDSDRIALAQKAGCLLSLAENTLEEIESSEFYQIFSNGKSGYSASTYTGIYFSGNFEQLSEFCERLEQLRNESRLNKINAYFFCQDNGEEFENEFSSMKNIAIKTIPEPILKIYQALGM